MTTQRQRNAIAFCEEQLEIPFKGDINNYIDVFNYLSRHLNDAKEVYQANLEEASWCMDIY